MVNYKGIDFSADWKVVTFEGKVVSAPWKSLKNKNGTVVGIVRDESSTVRPLDGFSNYRVVSAAAALFGGVAVRK